MTKTKSKAQLEAEISFLRSSRNRRDIATVLNNLIRWGTVAFIAYEAQQSIVALAGHETDANVNFLGKLDVSVSIAWMFGIGGSVYGWWQRKLRKDAIERIQEQKMILEKEIDHRRTSSKLTPRGDTRPEDRQ